MHGHLQLPLHEATRKHILQTLIDQMLGASGDRLQRWRCPTPNTIANSPQHWTNTRKKSQNYEKYKKYRIIGLRFIIDCHIESHVIKLNTWEITQNTDSRPAFQNIQSQAHSQVGGRVAIRDPHTPTHKIHWARTAVDIYSQVASKGQGCRTLRLYAACIPQQTNRIYNTICYAPKMIND